MSDRYFICDVCAHFWSSPEHPESCENCGKGWLYERPTVEAAEELSQEILDRTGRVTSD